jgi:hypothetical protein
MATVEYAALVVVVSLALAVGAAVAGAGALPRVLFAQVARAYCLVSGGDCLGPDGPVPCVRDARSRSSSKSVGAVLARLADGRTVLSEQRSDGTVAVTVTDMGEALGAMKLGRFAEGRLGARLSAGRRYVVADAAAARRLVAGLDRVAVGEVGLELARFVSGGGDHERFARFGTRGEATATLEALGLGPSGEAVAGLAVGLRIDGASGRRTLELGGERAVFAELASPIVRVAGGVERSFAVDYAVARDGSPLSLVIRRVADAHGEVGSARGGGRVEAEARLDLADPRARALFDAFLSGPSVASARALAARLGEQARIDVRVYSVDAEERTGGASVLGVGYRTVDRTETARLVDAFGRDPGRGWSRRLDCVGIA